MQITRKSLLPRLIAMICMMGSTILHAGNTVAQTHQPLSLLVSEILFDSSPTIGLPDHEYIELYNNSGDSIQLLNWIIRVGEKKYSLPSGVVAPGKYILLTSKSGLMDFSFLNIDLLSPDKWPTLRNSGNHISLLSSSGDIIHFMEYHSYLFDDPLKRNGGWSLELGDISNPCGEGAWGPSVNPSGGTPGSENSIKFRHMEPSPPKALRLGLLSDTKLLMILDSPVLPLLNEDWFLFNIDAPGLAVESWSYFNDRPTLIELHLSNPIPEDQILSMKISGTACDCSGLLFYPDVFLFGLPDAPEPSDVVISEILFDPLENQAEFIGVHNRSDKVIALNDLYLAICDEGGEIIRFSKPDEESFLMFPNMEYVLTADSRGVLNISDSLPRGRVCERLDFPSLSNSGSGLCIMDKNQVIIDKVRYDPDWLDSDVVDSKGYSLERISLDNSGMAESNWHMASFVLGGSTPGQINSQGLIFHDDSGLFNIENRVFTPNGDGFRDFLLVSVSTKEPGWKGSAGIWDLSGNRVRNLMEAAILPTGGVLKWDGDDEYGKLSPPGYYALIINYIRPDGSNGRWKEACLLLME